MDIIKFYKKYFDVIDDYFGSIKKYLGPEEDSHIDLGHRIASYPLISDLIYDATEDLGEEIKKFWLENLSDLIDFTKKQNVLKCVYSGDVSPVVLENFVKRSALYIDTVILPDPILNLSIYQRQILADNKYFLSKLIRHVFNVWKLKDLVLADTQERILLILPINLDLINSKDRDDLIDKANDRSISYLGNVLGHDFDNRESMLDFLKQYETSIALFENIARLDLLPNEFKKKETLIKFLDRFKEAKAYSNLEAASIGVNFGLYIISQFVRVQEHKFICDRLRAEPIYDYELPWFFFNYEIGGLDMDASIASALQREKFDWISKVPLPALKILREKNKLDYMRSVIRRGITDLMARTDKNLLEVSNQIEKNLKEEFQRQKGELKNIKKEIRSIIKKEIPITTGGFLAGFFPPVGNVVSLLSAGRDISRLFKKRKKLNEDLSDRQNDFINLLMNSYER